MPNQNIIHVGRKILKLERSVRLPGGRPPAPPAPTPAEKPAEQPAPVPTPPPAPPPPLEKGALQCDRGLGAEGNRCHSSLQVKALAKLMDSLQKQSLSLAMRMDGLATQLALRIAAKVIMREMENPQNMKSRIAHALARIPLNERLTLRLNPSDHEILEQVRGAQLDGSQILPADVILISDSSVQRGGCIVEGAAGTLDARIETQLKLIEQSLGGDRLSEK